MLSMRSTPVPDADLTTRARIRDAAIDLIGRNGFARVTVRQVAAASGVSPGLVIHHFTSKEGLRDACDQQVLRVFADAIADLEQGGPASAIGQLMRAEEFLPVVRYGTRTMADGGPMARRLFDRLVDDTEDWLAVCIANGTAREPDDRHAMAALLVAISLGLQILSPYLMPDAGDEPDPAAGLRSVTGSAVELYTHGVFSTTEYLDAFRELDRQQAGESAPANHGRQPAAAPAIARTRPSRKESPR
jgi:AcrR family transcriptional regulator